ncbi:MAG: glycosyltransferase family 87 protein, partial [Anaerolineales bacterium]
LLGTAVLLIFLLADSYLMYTFFTKPYPGANDFYARWRPTRAWLFEARSPYADSVTLDVQIGMYGHPARPEQDKGLFSYPFFSILFFVLPSLISDYAWASAIWLAVLQVALLGLIALSLAWSGWRPPPWLFGLTLLFSLFWYHTARTLILGQFAALNALMIVGALLAARSGRDVLAGILLALTTAKPQMTFLIVPGLLLWAASLRRRRLIAAFAVTFGALLIGSLLWLPSWPFEWRRQLTLYVDNSVNRSALSFIAEALLPDSRAWPTLQAFLNGVLFLYLLWQWWRARRATGRLLDWTAALTLVVTNLVALRTATTDYVMMTPALFLLFCFTQEAWGRRGLALVAIIQTVSFFGLWALFFATVQGDQEQSVMYLPLPILLLAWLVLIHKRWLNSREPVSQLAVQGSA